MLMDLLEHEIGHVLAAKVATVTVNKTHWLNKSL